MLERQNTKISISLKLGSINNGYIVQTINIVVVLPIMNLVVFYIKCWESINIRDGEAIKYDSRGRSKI
jgi:hypothetical protein